MDKQKIINKNNLNWIMGLIVGGFGVALCTKANFGLSMVSAPPYIIHIFLRQFYPIFTQGTCDYLCQAIMLVMTCIIVKHFEFRYLLSFMTAVIFGYILDGWFWVFGGNGELDGIFIRIIAFVVGEVFIALSVAFYFNTTLPVKVSELIVNEISDRKNKDKIKVKKRFDFIMLAITITLALVLNHSFQGIGVGTIIITIVNAPLINILKKMLEKIENRF